MGEFVYVYACVSDRLIVCRFSGICGCYGNPTTMNCCISHQRDREEENKERKGVKQRVKKSYNEEIFMVQVRRNLAAFLLSEQRSAACVTIFTCICICEFTFACLCIDNMCICECVFLFCTFLCAQAQCILCLVCIAINCIQISLAVELYSQKSS